MTQMIAAVWLTVAAHNYAGVPQRVLVDAQRDVMAAFSDCGVELFWTDALVRQTTMRVHLLSPVMASRAHASNDVLGLATKNSGMVYVLYDRVAANAERMGVPVARLLGFVIAHEIGHLLLPGHGHTTSGLMRPTFDKRSLARGDMRFGATERQLIRRAASTEAPPDARTDGN
jgi:hypothetical protein